MSMNIPTSFAGPNLHTLFALLPQADDMPEYELLSADEVPPPYHGLLVHEHHMTVTVETYHGDVVDVRILDGRQEDDWYARRIVLALHGGGRVVQFGIMRV